MNRLKSAFVALLALLVVGVPAVASASFKSTPSAALSVTTDTLSAPTNLKFTCVGSGGRITLTWTITSDLYATGYTITGTYSGQSQSMPVAPRTATRITPDIDVPQNTTITMVSVYRSWTSANSMTLPINKNCA